MKYDVLSLGPARMDVFMRLPDVDVEEVCSIDRRRCMIELGFGEKIAIREVNFSVGGNSGNNAVGVTRLGFKAAIVGAIGDQPSDDQVLTVLQKEGVETKYLQRTQGLGGYGVVINYQEERTILSYYGDPPQKFLDDASVETEWIYLTTAGGKYEDFYRQAVEWARTKGAKLAFNPGTRQVRAKEALRYVYEQASLVFVNREEAETVLGLTGLGTKVQELLKGIHDWGAKVVVITDGPNGAYSFDGTRMLYMPVVDAPVVERTGAGDAFGAGFMSGVLSGKSVEDAMRWGACNSGSVLGYVGPQAGLLHKEQMQTWLEKSTSVKVEQI
jgi:sugar/nucleoside kinase (ribokinase family)